MPKPKPLKRCPWAEGHELLARYHDAEWGVPVHDDRQWFEKIILDGAQAGLSWLTILKKREAYREAFRNFDQASGVINDHLVTCHRYETVRVLGSKTR